MKATISSAVLLLLLGTAAFGSLIPKKDGLQTLVLLDDWATLDTHSIFFESLRRDGHNLVFEGANPPPQIKYFDDYFYDNIIFMAPNTKGKNSMAFNDIELKTPIMSRDLIEYLEANHNLMIFADAEAKKPVRLLVNEFGVEFEAAVSGISEYYVAILLGLRSS
jgi:hypothetical protein